MCVLLGLGLWRPPPPPLAVHEASADGSRRAQGAHAHARQGHERQRSALQAHAAVLAEDDRGGGGCRVCAAPPPPRNLCTPLRRSAGAAAAVDRFRFRVSLTRRPAGSPRQVDELICKFSKKGLTPSQIGVLLRDNHGIAQVSTVTGSKVLRILKGHGVCLPPRGC